MPVKSILSRNIDAFWKDSGLTQGEFGTKFNSNQKSLWAYINGSNIKPAADFLFEICNYYQIDIDFLKSKLVKIKEGKIINYPKSQDKKKALLDELEKMKEEIARFNDRFTQLSKALETKIKSQQFR
jgi:transcriptional regulator with XRE-family HTH domain